MDGGNFPWVEGKPHPLIVMTTGSTHCRKTQGVPWRSILVRTLTFPHSPHQRWVWLVSVAMVMFPCRS